MNNNSPDWYKNSLNEGIIYDESGSAIACGSNPSLPPSLNYPENLRLLKTKLQEDSPKKED